MSAATAQILLTTILLVGAIIFVMLGQDNLALALVGALAGQGVSVGVGHAANGK